MSEIWNHYTELIRDPAHLMVELTFMLVVDVILVGLLWPVARKLLHRYIDRQHTLEEDKNELLPSEREWLKKFVWDEMHHLSLYVPRASVGPVEEVVRIDGGKEATVTFTVDGSKESPGFSLLMERGGRVSSKGIKIAPVGTDLPTPAAADDGPSHEPREHYDDRLFGRKES